MLAGWRASAARFREDANAEEDAAGGGYRDRLVVELAQNAADAARAAGVPGRLLLALDGDRLITANTGAALSAAGVEALSTLRASAKRDAASTGRFGVGFAAAVAVSDAPAIGSRGAPSVQWSRQRTLDLVAAEPGLVAELGRRGDHVPVLRLPFSAPPLDIPAGYDTVVALPLRDPATARRLLEEIDPTLPLMLPGLVEIVVRVGPSERVLRCEAESGGRLLLDGIAWVLAEASGSLPADLAGTRPAEERGEATWWVRALARADGGPLPAGAACVLRAPTPTDEPLSLPLVLAASVPLEPTRRRVLRGPLADHVLQATGPVLAQLAGRLDDPLPLVPVGLAAGDIDLAVREALLAALPETPVLQGMLGRDCLALDLGRAGPAVAGLLRDEVAGLLSRPWSAPMAALGVRRLDTADVVGLLAGLHRPPAWWQSAYAALADAPDLDALGALPVPLADGRVVTGARGALLPAGELPDLAALPVRLVHPEAAHPLLLRLGAQPASAASLLGDPAVRAAVEDSLDEPDIAVVRAVCDLVASAARSVADHPWLDRLALPAAGGGWAPAGDLLWPGGLMDRVVAPDGPFDRLDPPPWLERETAVALGVLDGPALLRAQDVPVDPDLHDPDPDAPGVLDLDGAREWLATLDGPEVASVVAVRDLETVADLPALVVALAQDRELRAAVLARPSYSAWWLGQRPVLGGLLPSECALGAEPLLAGLYAEPPALDEVFLLALGVRGDLDSILADPDATGDLLDRIGDGERELGRVQLRDLHEAAARAWAGRLEESPDPPLRVRVVLPSGESATVAAPDAVVVDTPDLLPLVLARGLGVVPVGLALAPVLAELLDVPLSSEIDIAPPAVGQPAEIPEVLSRHVDRPARWQRHEHLLVDGVPLPWRWTGGVLHATDEGLADGLAWAAGQWSRRHLFAALVRSPGDAVRLELEEDLQD